MSKKSDRLRRSVSFDDDVVTGLNLYRAGYLREGKEKRFGPAVNELLREILTQKYQQSAPTAIKEDRK